MRRVGLVALVCAGVAVGVLAEQQAYEWADLLDWLPDLLAGWTLIGLGVALLALRRSRGAAALLLVAGFSWFAINFETTGPAWVQWLALQAAYLHRGPLFHLAVAPPAGRPRSRLVAAGVALAWVAAVVWPLWNDDGPALLLAAAFVVIAAAGREQASGGRAREIAGRGLAAAAILAAVISVDAIRSLAGAGQGVTNATVFAYAVAVALAGAVLFTAAMLEAPAALAERAVALQRGGARLRDALRELLGDPELEIGVALDPGTLVDDLGRPLATPGPGLETTRVSVAGQQVAVVIHDRSTLDDAATRAAVVAAVGLAAQRARLQAEVTRQVDAVEASRRRLLAAEESERRRLAERLERGPGAELADVERLVREARLTSDGDEALAPALERASERLDRVRPELDALVHGLGGVGAGGLVPELERLAADLPLEAHLELTEVAVAPELASALWFVCSESLANTVKHARAGSVRVTLVEVGGAVRLTVEDDGRGGADPAGSGLVGLADRVAALGGRLDVRSPAGGGTRIAAELPLGQAPG